VALSEQFIDEVRESTDIVDLISEYVQLTKRGKNYVGLCPFHHEKTPSFSVSEDKQLYHCFGCHASGNVITFVRDVEGIPFVEAVVKLSERIGIQVPDDVTVDMQASATIVKEHQDLRDMHEVATDFYHHLLMHTTEGEEALEYLLQRGFTEETIKRYRIGWSLFEYEALDKVLQLQGFPPERIVDSTLVQQKDDRRFDRFRGRIMFPLFDDRGEVIAFSGRILKEDEKQPKYMNSPKSPIFEKNEVLYNIHYARPVIRQKDELIVFEGFMDSIRAAQEKIDQTVAVMGTSLSTTHLTKMKQLTNNIVICCDGDDAGKEASFRFAQLAAKEGMQPKIALLPEGKDPDDYLGEHGKEAFEEKVLSVAHSYMSFVMIYYKRHKNLHQPDDLTQYTHEVLRELSHRTSSIERDFILNELHEETGVSLEVLRDQLAREDKRQKRWQRTTEPALEAARLPEVKRERGKSEWAELLLLSHFLADFELFHETLHKHPNIFVQEPYQLIAIELAAFSEVEKEENYQRFAEQFDNPELGEIVLEAAQMNRSTLEPEREVADCLVFLERYRIEREIEKKKNEQLQAEKEQDFRRTIELAQEIIALRKSL